MFLMYIRIFLTFFLFLSTEASIDFREHLPLVGLYASSLFFSYKTIKSVPTLNLVKFTAMLTKNSLSSYTDNLLKNIIFLKPKNIGLYSLLIVKEITYGPFTKLVFLRPLFFGGLAGCSFWLALNYKKKNEFMKQIQRSLWFMQGQ